MKIAWCTLNGVSGHDAGRRLLRQLYREETGQDLPEIRITPLGKPYIPDSSLHFSITHTTRHAFCVLASCPVGIDAEELDRAVPFSIAGRIMSSGELARFQEAKDPARAFLTLWVLKEAAAKLAGTGLRGFPSHTNFSPEDSRVQVIEGCLVAILTENDDKE